MKTMKLRYEKPVAVDMGACGPVHGEACSSGPVATPDVCSNGGAATGCAPFGTTPHIQPSCAAGNNTLGLGNCTGNGNAAQNWLCLNGGAAAYGPPL